MATMMENHLYESHREEWEKLPTTPSAKERMTDSLKIARPDIFEPAKSENVSNRFEDSPFEPVPPPLNKEEAMPVLVKAADEIQDILISNVVLAGCHVGVIAPFMLRLAVSEMRQCGYNFDEVREKIHEAVMTAPDSVGSLSWSRKMLDKLHNLESKPPRPPLGKPDVNRLLRRASEDIKYVVLNNVVLAGCHPCYIPTLMVYVSIAVMQELGLESDEIRGILHDALGNVLAMHQASKVEVDFDFT